MEQKLKLWSFLHAFQKSFYRLEYMPLFRESLLCLSEPDLDAFLDILHQFQFDRNWQKILDPLFVEIYDQEKQKCRQEFNFTFLGQKDYPLNLKRNHEAPLALSYQGNLSQVGNDAISIVGSREPQDMTHRWMQTELYHFLKELKPSVISGGARGVDQKAHGIATLLDLPTAVMLPSGLASKYPNIWEDKKWNESSVVFVSEFPLGATIAKRHFSSRNRLIAAWGLATLIAEAHNKSGTLITAHHALGYGKDVWVVPGHPSHPAFAGSLGLCLHTAKIVRNANDMSTFFLDLVKADRTRPLE